MPRPAKPWRRTQDGWYYAKINGEQVKLSRDYEEAVREFHRLKAEQPTKPAVRSVSHLTIGELANRYLDHAQANKDVSTYDSQRFRLRKFADYVGRERRVSDLTGELFDRWTHQAASWGTSMRTAARATVLACLNWGVENGLLASSPLASKRRGRYDRRVRILTPNELATILGVLKGSIAPFIQFLSDTGARPFSEAARLTADMVDWQGSRIEFARHKNARKGKSRVVYLAPHTLALLRELADRYPTGPLFRGRKGNAWNVAAFASRARSVPGIAPWTAYAFRHTYITEALSRGVAVSIVAELVGSSTATIERYYSHLDQRRDVLREAARRIADG